jgi:ATP-dependent Clp protease ATP-binding subunit ClpA
MTTSLGSLIEDVENHSPTSAPLDLLVTAASTVEEVTDVADALLAHFVDRTRRAGHSWTEIGAALSVSKQAVQKRFKSEQRQPRDWERFTLKARNVVFSRADEVASELGHNYIGTEHLLLGMWGEPESVAVKVLTLAGLTREDVITDIDARVEREHVGLGGFTPRAWIAIENASRIAARSDVDYVGTEHLLQSLMSGVGGIADDILTCRGVSEKQVASFVAQVIGDPDSQP